MGERPRGLQHATHEDENKLLHHPSPPPPKMQSPEVTRAHRHAFAHNADAVGIFGRAQRRKPQATVASEAMELVALRAQRIRGMKR